MQTSTQGVEQPYPGSAWATDTSIVDGRLYLKDLVAIELEGDGYGTLPL